MKGKLVLWCIALGIMLMAVQAFRDHQWKQVFVLVGSSGLFVYLTRYCPKKLKLDTFAFLLTVYFYEDFSTLVHLPVWRNAEKISVHVYNGNTLDWETEGETLILLVPQFFMDIYNDRND
jgi:hypothetical protein